MRTLISLVAMLGFVAAGGLIDCRAARPPLEARQTPATARVSGRVLAADTGKPLRRATVRIAPPGATLAQLQQRGRSVLTDENGRWEITKLAAGRYEVTASRGGYVQLVYGQRRPFQRGTVLDIAAGQAVDKIDLTLPRASAITGRITDEFGEPVTNALVSALRVRYDNGKRVLAPLVEGISAILTGGLTDDLGQYRIHGLAPGLYYVSAMFGGDAGIVLPGDVMRYAATFYPGAISAAEAQAVLVDIGRDATNVSFSLTPLRAASVSGTIVSSAGVPVRVFAALTPSSGPMLPGREQSTTTQPDGGFTFTNVQPGEYLFQALLATSAVPEPELASVPVTVIGGEDITGLAIVTSPGAAVSGRVILEDDKAHAIKSDAFSVRVAGANPSSVTLPGGTRTTVREDGTFLFRAVLGPQLLRAGQTPPDWFLKSVVLDGKDMTDMPYDFRPGQKVSSLEVTFTRRTTTLAGTAQDERGQPIADYAIVAFSTDPARWGAETRFVRAAASNRDGTFQVTGLPADEYFVVALDSIEPGEEFDRERLDAWRTNATRLALADGESKSIVVTLR